MMPARKTTKFMTNCDGIHAELQRICNKTHEHQPLLEGRAKYAARYPVEFCRAICKGLLAEKH
eukprot:12403942-Karenia_brevis.AAC.1